MPWFCCLHRSPCAGKVIQRIVGQKNVQCPAFISKIRAKSRLSVTSVAWSEIRTPRELAWTEEHSIIYPCCISDRVQPPLVARLSRRKCVKLQKCRKCFHKQLKEISPKVSKWSKVNVPLFPNIPQQFPCSLKVILKYPLFPKSKWWCFLVPYNPWEALNVLNLSSVGAARHAKYL